MTYLRKGSDNPGAVAKIQAALCRVGYLTKIDGVYGDKTRNNIKAFQRDHGLKADGICGPITYAVLWQIAGIIIQKPDPTPVSNSDTPWMDWLKRNKGAKEIPGNEANQFIIDLFRYTSLAHHQLATSDETAWCAALACAALEKNGYLSPHSASAIEFDNYGDETNLRYGAIVTLKRTGGSGRHVTFFEKENGSFIQCLGGNQSNTLRSSFYPRTDVMAIRWPVKKQR